MGLRRIIALDLGKFKTVACVMDALDRSHVYETIEMSPAAMHDLLARHATAGDDWTRNGWKCWDVKQGDLLRERCS